MNLIKEWLAKKEQADASRPKDLEMFGMQCAVNPIGGINIKRDDEIILIHLSYDEGLAFREWLNRIYGNGNGS